MKEPNSPAAEAPAEEEKKEFLESRQEWRWAPPDFEGWVTHVDAEGRRFGAVLHSQFNPGWKFQNRDQFQPDHWEFDQYAPAGLSAGPEEIDRVTTGQESAGGPIEAELTMEHHSELMPFGQGRRLWGGVTRWVYAPFAFEKLYRLEVWKTLALEAGSPAELAGLKERLERGPVPANRPFQEKPLEGFWATLGFSFQDPTADLLQKLPSFGHPPGAVAVEVRPTSPAASIGLSPDDIVVMADWQVVEGAAALREILKAWKGTEPLTLIYWRQGVYYHGTIEP
jgi:hypothetical protein